MPNWITNTLKFKTSTPQAIIDNYFNGEEFDFEKIIPSPKKKEECPAEYYVNENSHIQLEDDRPWFDWYKWNCKHWFTKWGACNTAYEITNRGIVVVFDTAWDAPYPIFEKLIEKYGNCIEIKCYQEWGEKFYHYKGGKK